MATSESDDFESADEELMSVSRTSSRKRNPPPNIPSVVDSESDDDTHSVQQSPPAKVDHSTADYLDIEKKSLDTEKENTTEKNSVKSDASNDPQSLEKDKGEKSNRSEENVEKKEKVPRHRKPREASALKGKKLGAKLGTKVKSEQLEDEEIEMPEELKSNLKFKDVFKYDGWEGLEDDKIIEDHLTETTRSVAPVLDKISSNNENQENSDSGWGSWGSWGVSSLINTATASVSTLTSHVSQGLTLLEESIGAPDPAELAKLEPSNPEKLAVSVAESEESEPQTSSFAFSNLLSGVSSITKLVESTGTKVISGGLDTLEVIGKKTMEVLQEGDPGLKKKRALFLNETDKPNLSHILREAKERAETEEKSLEEKELARKVHFESLFDDFQGLVHLEALEMLSKQSEMKIEQKLIDLDGNDLMSMQETLEEVKELCDLRDEDEEEQNQIEEFKDRLREACKDLGVTVNYDKLYEANEAIKSYLSEENLDQNNLTYRQIFQQAISAIAQFTAYCVERFHKTAELLLVKERRSTVNEADALVQLAHILCAQIGFIANSFCDRLNKFTDEAIKADVNSSITTIFLEAANASSYIQDAFRLLIPILQVGAV